MSTTSDPRERFETYMLPGSSYEEEFVRQRLRNRLLTSGMGGVWPEQPVRAGYERVLEVGCGSGDWLVQAARTYPAIRQLFGVDIDSSMITQARALARRCGVDERAEFHVMDALSMLEFPFDFFDLVSTQQSSATFMRVWEWQKYLQEVLRVLKSDGVIRVAEIKMTEETASPALNELASLISQTLYQSGRYFSTEYANLVDALPCILERFGVREVDKRSYMLEFHAGTEEMCDFLEYIRLSLRMRAPLIAKWGRLPDDYREQCEQAQDEIENSDFVGQLELCVVWGKK